ncbi:MAG: DISARM system helicase DrmA [Desulfomonilaceae bacterium]
MLSVDVRQRLIDALRLDLVGPGEVIGPDNLILGQSDEVLPQKPSTWYLAGFLVPREAAAEQRTDAQNSDELDEVSDSGGLDDAATPERGAARVKHWPSSMGVSVLVNADSRSIKIIIRWGDYCLEEDHPDGEAWVREPREESLSIDIPDRTDQPLFFDVPNSRGLQMVLSAKPVATGIAGQGLPAGTKSVSLFLVNNRRPLPNEIRDQAFVFQAQIELQSEISFVHRPNLQGIDSDDWDEQVADLQYQDAFEYAVGHGVATEACPDSEGQCWKIRTCRIPLGEVERVAPAHLEGVELSMDVLGQIQDFQEIRQKLNGIYGQYIEWIDAQMGNISQSSPRRSETANELLGRAKVAANRIQQGVELLADPAILDSFRIANKVMAQAARRRMGVMQGKDPSSVQPPKWRPFQLAFILMNLSGIADPTHYDREVVDLLFFPTGGGKTEAYLGLAAFTLVLRRLRNPGIGSAGLSVLMRYTLRLLTLDQLSRAATLICALELERLKDTEKLGEWPFEIALWVGQAATPNVMGKKGDDNPYSARAKTIAFKNNSAKSSPIPLEECPWCGNTFTPNSFQLIPNQDNPTDLRVLCVNRNCDFTRNNPLPILAVDEPIYRRLPCFMIATVDKFAAMPWTGEVGQFFGKADRYDEQGFYGPVFPDRGRKLPNKRLLPPDLIIQDELHLISGPLGTVVGLYETALDELCTQTIDRKKVRAKIVASTATVRWAEKQIRALFNRSSVEVFPPPGPDRRDSFFAKTHSPEQSNPRWYLGVAAQGRSPKVVMLRVYLALLGAAQKAYLEHGKKNDPANPADPYMTLLGYFNSLRELGGARRVIEDEINNRIAGYGNRKRLSEVESLFADRKIAYEVVELTSRVSTSDVADAKRKLSLMFNERDHVDVAIATNMISVGLDIIRLGLMVVFGQPKTSSEYIQTSSRVGRDDQRPGLIVTILNIHKPRDRSHYERFAAYHQSFYRSVEVTSVTPFSPRALDRGLAGTLVGLSRQAHSPMTPPLGAHKILTQRGNLDFVIDILAERAATHADLSPQDSNDLKNRVTDRAKNLFDEWSKIAKDQQDNGGVLQYQIEVGGYQRLLYEFLNQELKQLPPRHKKFRANRSMRDVEPNVNVWVKVMGETAEESDGGNP